MGFAQKKSRHSLAQNRDVVGSDTNAWVSQCDPNQDTVAQKNPSGAGTYEEGAAGKMPGVGIECQGFAQRKSRSLAQYNGDSQEWVEPCDPSQDTVAQKNPSGAGTYNGPKTKGSFPGVGVECMGFAQRRSRRSLVQYNGDSQAWVEPCDPAQDTVAQKNPSGAGQSSFPGVGVECMGFAQKKSRSLAQLNDVVGSDTNAWVEKCDPTQDTVAQKNPSGAGTYINEEKGGSFPGVGVECQGFAQRKSRSLAQLHDVVGSDTNAWVDQCDAAQDTVAQKNPSGAGTYEEKNKGSFPGVGVDCQGFAQRKSRSLAQLNDVVGSDTNAWVDQCDPAQDTVAQKNPSGAGTYEKANAGKLPGVGIDCQGFAQVRSRDVVGSDTNAWVDKCDPAQDTTAQKNPSGAGQSTFPGVGVDCQGFSQK